MKARRQADTALAHPAAKRRKSSVSSNLSSSPRDDEQPENLSPPSLDLATPTPSASASPGDFGSDNDSDADVSRGFPARVSGKCHENDLSNSEKCKYKCPIPREKLSNIIAQQFDLEILLKHNELRHIDDEIAKVHTMMLQMRQFSKHTPSEQLALEPENFVKIYSQYLTRPETNSITSTATNPRDSLFSHHGVYTRESSQSLVGFDPLLDDLYGPRPQRSTALKSQSKMAQNCCLYRKSDGSVVKLICPKCNRGNFGSVQGFINHCRISHSLEFNSHDAAAAACGVAVSEDYQSGASANQSQSSTTDNISGKGSIADAAHANTGVASRADKNITRAPTVAIVSASEGPKAEEGATSEANVHSDKPVVSNEKEKTQKISNLASYIRSRAKLDVELPDLVSQVTEKTTKGYLFDGEEDFEEPEIALSDAASPFERVLAEARKLHLNVDEIRAAAAQASSSSNDSESKSHNKKKQHPQRKIGSSKPKVSSPARLSPALRCGDDGDNDCDQTMSPLFSTNEPSSSSSSYGNRRMPSESEPLVTRSKSRALAQQAQRPPTPPPNVSDKETGKKENDIIGNVAKYIQLSRFF